MTNVPVQYAVYILRDKGHNIEMREYLCSSGYKKYYVMRIDDKKFTTGHQPEAKKMLNHLLEVEGYDE